MNNPSNNRQRLLIVDDSKVIRVTARKILQNHFETVEAVDGNKAWELLTSEPPFSLIVSDLTMPGMDGFELLEKIRGSHLPHVHNIPVIIITGANDSEATKQRATDVGATDFIGKPFDAVHLLTRTQAHADAYTTELSLTQETMALRDQALTDPISGLANDSAFMERGPQQLSYAVRHGSDLGLFLVEIDNFGELYKQHGDAASTAAVKAVADILSANFRKEDMAARIGNSRFALLLPGMNKEGVCKLADRIITDVNTQPLAQGDTDHELTVSIGVAEPEISAETGFDAMLSTAADNLQDAIRRGGNIAAHSSTGDRDNLPETPATTPDTQSVPDDEILTLEEPVDLEFSVDSLPDLDDTGTGNDLAGNQPFDHENLVEDETIVITAPDAYYSVEELSSIPKPVEEVQANDVGSQEEETVDEIQSDPAPVEPTVTQTSMETPGQSEKEEASRGGFLSRLRSAFSRKR